MPAQNRILLVILGIIVIVTVILGGAFWYLSNFQTSSPISETLRDTFNISQRTPIPTAPPPIPTPQRIKPLTGGLHTYNFSHGPGVVGPKPISAVVNPLTPKSEEKQNFEVLISSESDVTEASVIVVTDNKETPYPLTLKEGNKQNGTWVGSWTLNDSYDYDYAIKFNLKNSSGTYNGAITFRMSI